MPKHCCQCSLTTKGSRDSRGSHKRPATAFPAIPCLHWIGEGIGCQSQKDCNYPVTNQRFKPERHYCVNMKLTICSSAHFAHESREIKRKLEKKGVEALLYPQTVKVREKTMTVDEFYVMRKKNLTEELLETKKQLMDEHIDKIKNSDAILVLNFDKPKNRGYVGGNSFLEMGVAYALAKKVFIWKKPSNTLPYYEEIMAMRPIIIEENLEKIE